MLRNLSAALGMLALFAACSPSPAGPTTTTSSSTTTIVDDTCERVAEDTVGFVADLIDQLDETRLAEFKDRAEWPEDLRRLERFGADLDLRVAALDCDAGAIRQAVFDRADLAPGGPLSEGLVDVLLNPPVSELESTSTTGPPDAATTSEAETTVPATTVPSTTTSAG